MSKNLEFHKSMSTSTVLRTIAVIFPLKWQSFCTIDALRSPVSTMGRSWLFSIWNTQATTPDDCGGYHRHAVAVDLSEGDPAGDVGVGVGFLLHYKYECLSRTTVSCISNFCPSRALSSFQGASAVTPMT